MSDIAFKIGDKYLHSDFGIVELLDLGCLTVRTPRDGITHLVLPNTLKSYDEVLKMAKQLNEIGAIYGATTWAQLSTYQQKAYLRQAEFVIELLQR